MARKRAARKVTSQPEEPAITAAVPVEQVQVIPVGPLPLIKAMLDELQVAETIQALVPNDTGEYDNGTLASVVMASRLYSRPVPLYAMSDWAAGTAVPALFGIPAEKLNDDRLGAMLDALRPQRRAVWGRIIARAVARFGVELKQLHLDPTKIAFAGKYAGQEALPEEIPRITYGRPKSGGPKDHKLLSVSTVVSADAGVPVWFGEEDGSYPDDWTYLPDLRELRAALPALMAGPLIIGGDSKLSSNDNLSQLCRWGYEFVAPEAWQPRRRERLAKLLRRGAAWQPLAYGSRADARKPVEKRGHYEYVEDPGELVDTTPRLRPRPRYAIRRIYIRSSVKVDQAQATRARQSATIQAELERITRLLNKYDYTTVAYVQARVDRALSLNRCGRYFQVTVTRTRAREAPLRLTWRLVQQRVQAEARWDGIYVLITNLPAATYSAAAVLTLYKDQQQAEWGFRDLNQAPLQIRPLWLHNTPRIEALVLLVMLAALVFALLERQVQRTLAERQRPIVGLVPEQRDTLRPTARRVLHAFAGLSVVALRLPGSQGRHYYLSELSPVQRQIIDALAVDLPALANSYNGLAAQVAQAQAPTPPQG